MGTDIACYAERKVEGIWHLAEPLRPNPCWSEEVAEEEPETAPQALFSTRNYALFSILANVRNPMRALEPFAYLAEPRGFPSDSSPELRSFYACYEADAHDAGWLLVSEIIRFDWSRLIRRRGMVDTRAAHLFGPDLVGFPFDDWPAGVPISVSEAGKDLAEVEWTETHRQAAGPEFFEATLPKLAGYGPAETVRIVFWFHS